MADIEAIKNQFQSFLQEGFSDLENGNIAVLSYRKANREKQVSFAWDGTWTEENIQGRRYPVIKIKLGAAPEKEYKWTAKWSITTDQKQKNLQFRFKDLNNAGTPWAFCTINDDEELSIIPDLKPPRPNQTNIDFYNFWFDESEPQGFGVNRINTPFNDDFNPFNKNNTLNMPPVPEVSNYNDELYLALEEDQKKQWAKFFIGIMCWRFILICGSGKDDKELFNTIRAGDNNENSPLTREIFGEFLPDLDDYIPRRPVDIDPHNLSKIIEENGLWVPWHVIAGAAAALNAGKHLIFTGPPGCGKTHIAQVIAEYASQKNPLIVTASQAWTTDEVIGRYMPNIDGKRLEFKEGFFLKALENAQWLIIDEINRCDIDNCFGELFTVLSGQNVTLPFEKFNRDKDKFTSIQIVVDEKSIDEEAFSISYQRDFRLLATMNDSDIAGLNSLSFALRRRFAIIQMDAPNHKTRKEKIFQQEIERIVDMLDLHNKTYKLRRPGENRLFNENLQDFLEKLEKLFASENSNCDLIELRVVGIAPVKNIVRFVGEGLRSPTAQRVTFAEENQPTLADIRRQLLSSFLAMGLVLNVFPQLDAVTGETDRFTKALECIFNAFGEGESFWNIERGENDSLILREKSSIREYLAGKLRRQYATDPTILDVIEEVFAEKQENA
ncbi:AAA family ATPase [Thermodesulfobacteriota bacterium B35]